MSLTTAGNHCTISLRLSGAIEDCSIVQVQQPRTLCRQRCCYLSTKFGQLVRRKIIEIIATICKFLRLKCTEFDFHWGSTPDTSAPQTQTP